MLKIVNPEDDGNIFLCNVSKFLLHRTVEDLILHSHGYGHIKLLCMDFDV